MRTRWSMLLPTVIVSASVSVAQTASVTHNTWTSGAPIPTAVWFPATAALDDNLYLVGGCASGGTVIADTQIYNPATDVWTSGTPLPTPTCSAAAAVVNNILYVIGGSPDDGGDTVLNSVWAYNPKTNKWVARSPMPTARDGLAVDVANSTIYVIGGNSCCETYPTVESYDTLTNAWTEETPLLTAKTNTSTGIFGSKATDLTIVDADGSLTVTPTEETGDNEKYSVLKNFWTALAPDPTPRDAACAGAIGSELYVAGGRGTSGSAIGTNESFELSMNTWSTLASMTSATAFGGSAVYQGQLYCFGGSTGFYGDASNNVQIYQP